jgi:hypothetical protein
MPLDAEAAADIQSEAPHLRFRQPEYRGRLTAYPTWVADWHLPTRTRGTIGGSIAHADPSAEIPMVLQALAGEVEVRG